MPSEKNLILPITTTPNQTPDAKPDPASWPRKRTVRYVLSISILAVIIITVLILAFTVFKIKEPTMTLNSINLISRLDLARNSTVIADVSVKNTNSLSFTFKSSTTSLLYRNNEVGSAYGPPGTVGAHRTLRTNVTIDVITDRLLNDSKFVGEIQTGSFEIQTSTMVSGKVKIMGMFRRHVDVMMNCSVNVSIASQGILDQHCTHRMWL